MNLNSIELCLNIDKADYNENTRNHKIANSWYLVATKGSHQQYKHPTKPGRVTIAGHPGDVLSAGTLNSILKQDQSKKVK